MNLAVIVGSHRPQSESLKVGKYIQKRMAALDSSISSELVELGGNPLPLWDESIWQGSEDWKKLWAPFADKLNRAEGFVVISPEWGGMVPPGLKNFFLLCTKQELSHKPGMIVTVSAGLNGAYPVAELRSSSYKNNQLCYTPEHVIVRNVTKNLNNLEKPESPEDEYIRGRMDHALKVLFTYTDALKVVRERKSHDFKKYPFGM